MIILEKHGEATELTSDFHGFPSKEYTKIIEDLSSKESNYC